MAETTDKLGAVKCVGSLLHPAHGRHFLVHLHQALARDLEFEPRRVQIVAAEGVLMQLDLKRRAARLR